MFPGANRLALLFVILFVAAIGCRSDKQPVEQPVAEEPLEEHAKHDDHHEDDHAGMPHASAIPATINQMLHDQRVPGVNFSLTHPTDGQVLESGEKVEVRFSLEGYRIGHQLGQHVHVILNNNPYIAHYDASKPVVLENLEPGTHVLRAFPSRHYHMSLKEGDVFDTVVFHVGAPSDDFDFDPERPYITYSRPTGTYTKAAGTELLLDFWVKNVTLGQDAKVRWGVGDQTFELLEWAPLIMPPLQPGTHTVTLELLDMQGNRIENGIVNYTEREITIEP